jgi:hypothetical protein
VEVTTLHAKESLAREIAIESEEAWSKEGAAIAMRSAYPEYLERNAPLSKRYQDEVFAIAGKQSALAGYRLARVLERLLARGSESAPDLLPDQVP